MGKTLGQIAFEAPKKRFAEWDEITPEYRAEWEAVASAVAAAVKEEDATICESLSTDWDFCAAAIRASIKP